jgi:hypothetical protein
MYCLWKIKCSSCQNSEAGNYKVALCPEIKQIHNVACPTESQAKHYCQQITASFNIALPCDDDSSYLINFYGNKTRNTIESGALQQILRTIDLQSSFVIMNYTELLQSSLETAEPTGNESSKDGTASFSLFVVLGVAIGASFFGAGLLYFFTNTCTCKTFVVTGFDTSHGTLTVDQLNKDHEHHDVFYDPVE